MWDTSEKELVGLTVDTIDWNDESDYILIRTKCGRSFEFMHDQDCCESVRIVGTNGDPQKLIGKKLVNVIHDEGADNSDDYPIQEWEDSRTDTQIYFITDTDTVISKWVGESNGYYSESVNLHEITKNK